MIEAILNYDFIRNAFIAGLILGFIAPLIGVFVITRKLAFITDTLSHVALMGVAFGMYLNKVFQIYIEPLIVSLFITTGSSLLIEKLRSVYNSFKELVMPIVLSGSVALSVIFISLANGFNKDIFGFLFGSINTITSLDLLIIVISAIITLILILLFYNTFLIISFDENSSKFSVKFPTLSKYVLAFLIALSVTINLKIFGALLVSALVIIPVATAMKIANSFKKTIIYAIIISEISIIAGFITAFHLDFPSGAVIVLYNIFAYIIFVFILPIIKNKFRLKEQTNV